MLQLQVWLIRTRHDSLCLLAYCTCHRHSWRPYTCFCASFRSCVRPATPCCPGHLKNSGPSLLLLCRTPLLSGRLESLQCDLYSQKKIRFPRSCDANAHSFMESFNVFYAAQFFHACAFSKVPLYSAFSSTLHILTHLSAISLLMHISPFPTIISISQGQSLGSCGCRSCCQDLSKPDTTGRTQRGLWDSAGSSWVSPCFSSFEGAFHWRRGAALSQPTRWGTLTWHPMIQIYQIYNISI